MQATASRGVNDNVASVLMRAEVVQHMDPRSLARCLAQGLHMEAKGVKTVLDLARVNIYNMELVLRLTLCDDTADGRRTARRTLWRRKCAAAALVGVDDIGELPSLQKRAKRTPVHQRALDVAARWAASRAGTADDEAATEYATALAAIARRQLSKNSSGGDGVAKPLRKKQHC